MTADNQRSLLQQIALVTGAAGGIGRAIAAALGGCGVHVCLAGRNVERLEAAGDEVRAGGGKASIHRCDLRDDDQVRGLADAVLTEHGRIDILVHSAGVISAGLIEFAAIEDFDAQMRLNVRAPLLLTQLLMPSLLQSQGQIVFINSSVGVRTKEGVGTYAASKHALKALADTLRMEVNSAGVRVLSVFPGNTASDMQRALQEQAGRRYDPGTMLQPTDVAAATLNALRMPATAEVTDIHIRPMRKS